MSNPRNGGATAAGSGHGRPFAKFMVEFTIIHMCLFHVFKRQLEEAEALRLNKAKQSAKQKRGHLGRNPSQELLQADNKRRDSKLASHDHNSQVNNRNSSAPMRRLLQMRKLAQLVYTLFYWSYLTELIRFAIVELLSCDFMSDYQLADCFVLGRFRFIGRTNKISGRMVILFTCVFGGYRLIAYQFDPEFRYFAFEFLMYPYSEVLATERAHAARQEARNSKHKNSHDNNNKQESQTACDEDFKDYDPTFYIRSPFGLCEGVATSSNGKCGSLILCPQSCEITTSYTKRNNCNNNCSFAPCNNWILRPNRTAASWRILARCSEIMLLATLGGSVVWAGLLGFTVGGSVLSDLGFELAYPACVNWLQRAQGQPLPSTINVNNCSQTTHSGCPYASLYVAPALLAHQMDIDDIPAIIPITRTMDGHQSNSSANSLYQTARIFIDILENGWWYMDFVLICTSITGIFAISSLDIILNAREIQQRLEVLIHEMSQARNKPSDPKESTDIHLHIPAARPCWQVSWGTGERHHFTEGQQPHNIGTIFEHSDEDEECVDLNASNLTAEQIERMSCLQAILVDHFKLVRGYNGFISFALSLILGAWCAYTLILTTWMASVKSKALEFEFLLTEIGGTLIAVYFFSLAAVARAQNQHLYGQIARAMALDSNGSSTKLRWTTILKFYAPKSLYCFTLLGSTEISWLFCLQFVWWIVSAYIVLTNFLYINKL